MTETEPLTVYYDGECPICTWEIGMYSRMRGGDAIRWVDASDPASPLGADLPRDQALGKFHARTPEGQLVAGGQAFVLIWARLKSMRWAARLGRTKAGVWVLERAYRFFLRVLPWLRRRMGAPVRA